MLRRFCMAGRQLYTFDTPCSLVRLSPCDPCCVPPQHIIDLMLANVHVAIVTAAGYPGEAERFEQRVAGLLNAFRFLRLPDSVTSRCAQKYAWRGRVV